MDEVPRARTWRITLTDGQTIDVTAVKVVVADGGTLMFLDGLRAANPLRIYAPEAWRDCAEVVV